MSIIILNWNEGEHIEKCLEHVFEQTYTPLEVVVVDNGSTDGSSERIESRWQQVNLVRNPRNLGFAKGMNIGIEKAQGKYLLLLNADMFLEPNFIGQAVQCLERHAAERVGMFSAIVFRHQGGRNTGEIDHGGLLLLPYHTIVDSPNLSQPESVLGPAGSAMFVSREMLEDIRLADGDYLDSTYFVYGEDIQLFLRGQINGWKCLFQPIVAGWHIGSAAVGETRFVKRPDFLQVHAIKNRFFTLLTCYPFKLYIWTLPWQLLADAGTVGLSVITGRWSLLRNWLNAVGITIKMLPSLLGKRRWIQKRRRVSCAYLKSLFIKQGGWETLRGLIQKA